LLSRINSKDRARVCTGSSAPRKTILSGKAPPANDPLLTHDARPPQRHVFARTSRGDYGACRAGTTSASSYRDMKALVYVGPTKNSFEERPKPEILAPTDAVVKVAKTTICGTDLHI